MNIEEIIQKVSNDQYIYSAHADAERKADDLTIMQVEEALLSGTILETYPEHLYSYAQRGLPLTLPQAQIRVYRCQSVSH